MTDETSKVLEADLYAAMERIRDAARRPEELRRALKQALAELFAWREHELRVYRRRTGMNARDMMTADTELGALVEGLLLWRIVAQHHPEQLVELREYGLYPGERTFPSPWLYPGSNLCIVDMAGAPERVTSDGSARAGAFREHVAGRPLLPLLDGAALALRRLNAESLKAEDHPGQ